MPTFRHHQIHMRPSQSCWLHRPCNGECMSEGTCTYRWVLIGQGNTNQANMFKQVSQSSFFQCYLSVGFQTLLSVQATNRCYYKLTGISFWTRQDLIQTNRYDHYHTGEGFLSTAQIINQKNIFNGFLSYTASCLVEEKWQKILFYHVTR